MSRAERLVKDGFKNVRQAAAFLGISKSSMYDLVKSETISHARFRGVYVIPVTALEEYAAKRLVIGKVA